jgi:hypothetical protein
LFRSMAHLPVMLYVSIAEYQVLLVGCVVVSSLLTS